MSRKLIGVAFGLLACAALTAGTAGAQIVAKCDAAKLKAIGKDVSGLLGCESKAAAKGIGVDSACQGKAHTGLASGFTKAEKAGTCAGSEPTCQSKGDACESAVAAAMHTTGASKCEGAKLKAAGKLAAGELGCYSKAVSKAVAVDSACLGKVQAKFTTAIGKANGSSPCPDGGSPQALVENNCVQSMLTTSAGTVTDVCPGGGGSTTTTLPGGTTTTTLPGGSCPLILPGHPISGTYKTTTVGSPDPLAIKLCTQNSADSTKAFKPCTVDSDCGVGSGSGTCFQTPWVTLGAMTQPVATGSTTTFTVAEDTTAACNHAACIPCGNLQTCPTISGGCHDPNQLVPCISDQCCSNPGFILPSLFISGLNICTRVDQNACGTGVVNTSNPQTGDNEVKKSGDTSDPGADCVYGAGDPVTTCATADNDSKGLVFRHVGNGSPDATGVHFRLATPGLSTSWAVSNASQCPSNRTFNNGDTLVTQLELAAEPSTAGAIGEFKDHNADGCAIGPSSAGFSVSNKTGPFTVGPPAVLPMPAGAATGFRTAAAGIVFSNVSGEKDIGFIAISPTSPPVSVPTVACTCSNPTPPVGCAEVPF